VPGIFGIISKQQTDYKKLEVQFERMGRLLKHFDFYNIEKLDGDGYIFGRIGIPYRGYKFTHFNDSSGRGIVYDGYMYGWRGPALSGDLSGTDPLNLLPFDANGRVELPTIPEYINGSFTMSLYDKNSDSFYLANDRIGFRHLYYFENDELIAFAPETKAFLALDAFNPQVDNNGLADFFNYCFCIGGRTLLKDVKHLRPASIITIKNRTTSEPKRYWTRQFDEQLDGDETRLSKEMFELANDVLNRQINGQNNLIMALSGGMDSRALAYMMSQANRNIYYFSHGTPGCADVAIAEEVASSLGITDRFSKLSGDPECYSKYGPATAWLVDGMTDISCSFLVSVLSNYNKNPLEYEFINSLFSGAMNFASPYGKLSDVTEDLSHQEKINRIKMILGAFYFDDAYYDLFSPDFASAFKKQYDPHLENEFALFENAGKYFVHEKDSFFLETRHLRLSNQYDLNRYFFHNHMVLIDDEFMDFYYRMPMKLQVERNLYKKMFYDFLPKMAKIKYQKTGVDLFSKPSRMAMKLRDLKAKGRYYSGRLSMGKINLYDYNNYVQINQWYRQYSSNQKFYENILFDKRTLTRGYYNNDAVKRLLQKQARGSDNFNVISSLATFELFCRYFIDGETPPDKIV